MNCNTTDSVENIDLFLNKDESVFANLGLMAAKIALYNFQWRYSALVVFFSSRSEAVNTFLSNYNKSVAIKLGKFQPRYRVHVPQFVLFGEESSEIIEYLNWLIEKKFDNTGNYLLICYSKEFQKCNESNIFKATQKIYISNVVFLRIGNGNEPIPFTYQIIMPGICKNNKPERLNITNSCYNDSCFKLAYHEKLKNLQKCPLIVSTFEQPPFMYLHNGTEEPTGGDADMLKIVTSVLNATLIIKTPADGDDWGHYVDNNWTGSMGDVYNDHADLSVCSLPLTSHKYGNFQISFIYSTMDIVWVAKLPALKPSWEKLIRPFNIHVRIYLLVTFIFIIILTALTRTHLWTKARKLFNIGNTKYSVVFYSWAIFLGIPLVKLPSKRALLIVVYGWMWFCFIMRNSYQAALIHSLKNKAYKPKYESFDDTPRKNHTYGGQGSYREYFANEKKIYDNWEQLTFKKSHEMLHKISNSTSSFVLAFNKEMVIEHLLHHNGRRRLQMIPQKIVNSPTVMYLRKYSPLAAPLNTILSRAVEAGYAQAWHMRFSHKKNILFKHPNDEGAKALNLEHFGGCFMFTLVGWAVSILFFIIEVYCGRIEEYSE